MRILLFLSNELKQNYVINELSKYCDIAGVIVEDKYTPLNRIRAVLQQTGFNFSKISQMLSLKAKISEFEQRDPKTIKRYFSNNGDDKSLKTIKVNAINCKKSIQAIKNLSPELVIVFGTSLIGDEIMSLPSKGIINVHTGLSPYYRGGQCAFWCLYNDQPEYIGVTIHWLNKGIDSGDIILQGRPEICAEDTLCDIECKLALLATELLKKSIIMITNGEAIRVKQAEKGRLYLSKEFTLEKRLELEDKMSKGLLARYLERKDSVYNKVRIVDA